MEVLNNEFSEIDHRDSKKPENSKEGRVLKRNYDNKHLEPTHLKVIKEDWKRQMDSIRTPRNIKEGQMFCSKCDPNYPHLDTKNIELSTARLSKQVVFVPDIEGKDKGNFKYRRMFNKLYDQLPLQYNVTYDWAIRLNEKLNRLPNCVQELNFRMRVDYLNKRLLWYDDFVASDPKLKDKFHPNYQTFLPTLLIHNPKSTSSPLRLVQTPNLEYRIEHPIEGQSSPSLISYNSCMIDLSPALPPIDRQYILYALNVSITISDIKDFFKNVQLDDDTVGRVLQLAFKSNDGTPTLNNKECKDKNLYPTVWKFQVYGTKDSPAVSTYALTQCPVEYKKRTRTTNLVCPIILENIQRSLSQLTYVDDHHESANSSQILNFFKDLPNLSLITGHFKLELGQKEIYTKNKFSMFDPNKTGIENMLIISEKYLPNKESFSAKPRINVSSKEKETKELNIILSSMTEEKFANFILELSVHHSIIVCLCLQKVINYGNFFLKKFHSTNNVIETVLNQSLKTKTEIKPDAAVYQRPKAELIHNEFAAFSKKGMKISPTEIETEENPNPDKGNIMAQLGKVFLPNVPKDQEIHIVENNIKYKNANKGIFGYSKLKSDSLMVYKNIDAKGPTIKCNSYEEFLSVTNQPGYQFTSRSLLKAIMALYDPSLTHLFVATLIGKRCWQDVCRHRSTDTGWDSLLPEEYTKYMQLMAYSFFNVCKRITPRVNLILHPTAKRYLIGLPDSGTDLFTFHIIILTQVENDNNEVINAAYEMVALKMFVNKANFTMPEKELLALTTCINETWQIRKFLEKQTYYFDDENVIFVSDSQTALIQVRTASIAYNLRVGALTTKARMILAEMNLDPFKKCVLV